MDALVEVFLNSFITLTVIVDPLGTAAVFCALTANYTTPKLRATALRATIIAFCLLLFFGVLGNVLLQRLGISLPAFRIAGGLLLFISAFRMLFGHSHAEDGAGVQSDNDIAVFPIAIPLLAGPGCMTAIILLMSRAHDMAGHMTVLGGLAVTHVVALLCLLCAAPIRKALGAGGINILARVMGIILAAMSVQFVADGLRGMQVIPG